RLGDAPDIRRALEMEYRFTFRAMERADFLEGIRAAIIDKDRNPRWRHAAPDAVPAAEVARLLMPLGADTLTFEEDSA
ncbi:MAG TPA: enoyl-CoA hydratase/isomerase family protein, partial [Paracoccaceae bacterium]|nr:enoyl-CoA hydratase/isomerase family protein [Paracoccaceae bacterium]